MGVGVCGCGEVVLCAVQQAGGVDVCDCGVEVGCIVWCGLLSFAYRSYIYLNIDFQRVLEEPQQMIINCGGLIEKPQQVHNLQLNCGGLSQEPQQIHNF